MLGPTTITQSVSTRQSTTETFTWISSPLSGRRINCAQSDEAWHAGRQTLQRQKRKKTILNFYHSHPLAWSEGSLDSRLSTISSTHSNIFLIHECMHSYSYIKIQIIVIINFATLPDKCNFFLSLSFVSLFSICAIKLYWKNSFRGEMSKEDVSDKS